MSLSKLGGSHTNVKKLLSEKLQQKADDTSKTTGWFLDLVNILTIDRRYNVKLSHMTVNGATLKWLVIMRSIAVDNDPTLVQLKICSNRSYNFQVHHVTKLSGTFTETLPRNNLDVHDMLEYLTNDDYAVCPGILDYSKFKEKIKFDSKHARVWKDKDRVDSDNCLLWYKPGRRTEAYGAMCDNCRSLWKTLKENLKRAEDLTSPAKANRLTPSSNRGLKFLSPSSRKRRCTRKDQDRRDLKKLLRRMRKTDIELNDEQNDEMIELTQTIENHSKAALCEALDDIGRHDQNKGEVLRKTWELDMCDRRKFTRDQAKNVTGLRGNRWNIVTFRLALSVYIRSTSAYNALKSFPMLNLPSISTLRKFMKDKLHAAGECDVYLADQKQRYLKKQENLQKNGQPTPDGFGLLIFDEVKVMAGIMWNSKSNAIIGYAMTPDELHSLHDIYFSLNSDSDVKSNYMLQFLWRDLCADFDVMGPYYSSATGMENKILVACIIDAMQKLHKYGFKTKVLMCDGASSNLTALKGFMGHKGCFGFKKKEDGQISHAIDPTFYNPYTNESVFVMICPTHQLKNMIAQLYASRKSGTKSFEKDEVQFGWAAIQSVYQWNLDQAKSGHTLPVPGLKLSYVVRDSWTRLNVRPAKLMQQDTMLSALKIFAQRTTHQGARASIDMTVQYLTACNKMFEGGILSCMAVRTDKKTALDNILEGYSFFEQWLTGLLSQQEGYNPGDSQQKLFLAWQTWDLLRIMVFGFSKFCDDFFEKYDGKFFIIPKRLNGSAIETLFSQFKHLTGGKLSSTNYATARAAYLMKVDIHGRHSGETDYRNVDLYLRESEMSNH